MRALPLLAAAAFAAGCATTEGETANPDRNVATAAGGTADYEACFYVDRISSWRSVDDETIHVRVAPNDNYELKLATYCPALFGAQVVEFDAGGVGRVCEGQGLFVKADNMSCRIKSISPLPKASDDKAMEDEAEGDTGDGPETTAP